ncbi:MAG: alpha-L-arabinofuranosidase C-terminal domain-containing protein [Candidatus Pedobacter colombiensis]|uniref:non-reducing end alpha-L-arabinofuranosidase n=1 Tax=Candidatus Pedobacter colombiensis TaxID=3121371 RepID=A0AAJ5W8U5_9SPHI|nr:alpha-L-arabinofuranosidase C-terminal domain-containing protein [Pedobacter sp.]WEK20196.1 MAG: alpha-L-arabinofuranosidase C-terminal domain-containing protein [Pedobacter sp.]
MQRYSKFQKVLMVFSVLILLFSESFNPCLAQSNLVFKVKTEQPAVKIPGTMWGVFFEDINFGADGGIYAELIKNRSFEFGKPLMGWTIQRKKATEGELLVVNRKDDNPNNPRYLQVTVSNPEPRSLGITNEGFKGMGIKKGLRYDFSILYRQTAKGVKLHVELLGKDNKIIGQGELVPAESSNTWKKQTSSFYATETDPKARLTIWFEGNGKIDLDMLSLFPEDTWMKRPGGLRADMVQMLADMKPGFVRFPGGCIVEGVDLANRYQWKKTIGPVEERQTMINRWNTEFPHRAAPDYYQTFGLGFFEYFQLSEDIGAEPLPILNCGMACQFNTGEVAALEELDPYVKDALDLIEFANGDVDSKWGKVRAEMGHPKPFNLKMMGVGNENWGPQYLERLKVFTDAIKARYPNFKLIASSGTDPDNERFHFLNNNLRQLNTDIIDEHYYRPADWFLKNAGRYDTYARNGSKVFAGEYAVHADKAIIGSERNNWQSAIAAAAFMTGLERNAEVIEMASYAPLFAHIDAWQWAPDMIWVDNLKCYGTPDYYVQKLFSLNKGTELASILLDDKPVTGQAGLYASAVIDQKRKELIVKIVNHSDKLQDADFSIANPSKFMMKGLVEEMTGNSFTETNTFNLPTAISPKQTSVKLKDGQLHMKLKPYSFNVIQIPFK